MKWPRNKACRAMSFRGSFSANRHSSNSADSREQRFLRLIQCRQRLPTRDGGKVQQEIRERVPHLQVIHEYLKRNASPNEDRDSAKDLRIDLHD